MLTDVILKFEIAETGELIGEMLGFTTEMASFHEGVHILIGDLEIEVDDVAYDILSRRQVIEGTIPCVDSTDALEVREEVAESLLNANFSVFDIEVPAEGCSCEHCGGDEEE